MYLFVIDGTSPGSVGMAVAQCDNEFLVGANKDFTEVTYKPKAASAGVAPCVITDLNLEDEQAESPGLEGVTSSQNLKMPTCGVFCRMSAAAAEPSPAAWASA